MEQRRLDPRDSTAEPVRRGWKFGGEEFVAWLLERVGEREIREGQLAQPHQEAMEQKAERLVRQGLSQAGWREEQLCSERKGHIVKIRLARRLRPETTMPLKWIARRLSMGRWTTVSNLLRMPHAK